MLKILQFLITVFINDGLNLNINNILLRHIKQLVALKKSYKTQTLTQKR